MLNRKRDFDRVRTTGKSLRGTRMAVQYAPNRIAVSRLGMAVSKRAAPRAIDRNRVRRRLRAIFKLNSSSLPGLDIVAILRAPCASLAQAREAAADFALLLAKLTKQTAAS